MTRIIAFFLLLSLALAVMFMFFLSYIVEYGITAKTGFPTRVEELNSNPFRGSVSATGFGISNPDHYPSPDFIDVLRMEIKASPVSFFRDRIVVERVEIEIPSLTGVRNAEGRINFEEFRSVVEEQLDERKSLDPGKEVVIERLRLVIDRVVLVDYALDGGESVQEYSVNIDLELTDVTSLRSVAPELFRRFASAGISFDPDAIFTAIVPERFLSRVRSEIGADGGLQPEAGNADP